MNQVRVAGTDVCFDAAPDQTVLDAAEAAGWSIPYSCRKGVCATCAGGLSQGKVVQRGRGAVPAPAGDVLLCQAVPDGPVEITPRSIRQSRPPRRKTIRATVYRIRRPAPRVTVIDLRFPIGLRAPFHAGQYLRVLLDDGDSRLYSMANSPQHNDSAQLHVRTEPGGRFSDRIVACGARKYDSGASCGQLRSDVILVGEPAKDSLPADPVLGEVDRFWWTGVGLSWGELTEGTVRPGGVVVPQVLGQHLSQVLLIDDQRPVEELPAQGADHRFADRVRLRCLRWAGQDPGALGGEHGIERAGELASAVPDQELD
jgi:ferredoxin